MNTSTKSDISELVALVEETCGSRLPVRIEWSTDAGMFGVWIGDDLVGGSTDVDEAISEAIEQCLVWNESRMASRGATG